MAQAGKEKDISLERWILDKAKEKLPGNYSVSVSVTLPFITDQRFDALRLNRMAEEDGLEVLLALRFRELNADPD